jgi:hypothetical protein
MKQAHAQHASVYQDSVDLIAVKHITQPRCELLCHLTILIQLPLQD